MGISASVLPPTIRTSEFADQRGRRPARRSATLGIRIGAPIVALLGTILLSNPAMAATAINLGTAADFAILAGDTITNTPTSVIDGAVGVTPGTAIDLTCAEVTGTIYTVSAGGPLCREVNPGLLTTAKNALTTAYNSAAGQTPDFPTLSTDNQLGGQTLVPGVYRFTGAATANLIGNLNLSGNADDVWIFQATSTLVTAAGSSVSFIGGAQACNVFWQVGSSATLGANSDFAGTILAFQDISLGNSVTVEGRLLAGGQANHAGAVTLISDTITRSDCAAAPAPTDTAAPVATPTAAPVATPTAAPAATPTAAPAATPTAAPGATAAPAATPTAAPTVVPLGVSATQPSGTQPNTSTGTTTTQSHGPSNLGYVLVLVALALGLVIFKAPKRTDR